MNSGAKNVSASVRQRLLNLAKASRVDYNQMLIRHAIERLLYRLAISPHAGSFVLKGAMLFSVWRGSPHRPTQDLDLLGFGDPSPGRLVDIFRELCVILVEEDGWRFNPDSVVAEAIRTNDEYGGVRVHVTGQLGSAIVRVQVDVGFGDAITPVAEMADYPVLLEQKVPRLKVYPQATVVAEKTEAISKLGMLNTRYKDYYDLDFLADQFDFDGGELVGALVASFTRRETELPDRLPTGLMPIFARNPIKMKQWGAFIARVGARPVELPWVVKRITLFLESPLLAAHDGVAFAFKWRAGGPWVTSD